MVVIATIGILAGLLLPVLANAKATAHKVKCMSNHRQLALTWLMYADDNEDKLALNRYVGANGVLPAMWVQGYYNHWASPNDGTNSTLITDPRFSQFASYLAGVKVYHCPADRLEGTTEVGGEMVYPHIRSVAMNWSLGWVFTAGGVNPSFVFRNKNQIPEPSNTILITDVNPRSLCWPFFGIFQYDTFHMLPGSYHRKAGVMSLTDGHVESRKWEDPRTLNIKDGGLGWHEHSDSSAGNADLRWLRSKSGIKHPPPEEPKG